MSRRTFGMVAFDGDARRRQQERAARWRERERIVRQPGGQHRLRAIGALEQEQRFLALADGAQDGSAAAGARGYDPG